MTVLSLLIKTDKRERRVGKVPAKVEMQRCRCQEKTEGQRPARLSRIISLSDKRYPGHHHFLFFLNHPSVPAGAMVQSQQLNGVEAFSKRPGHAGI